MGVRKGTILKGGDYFNKGDVDLYKRGSPIGKADLPRQTPILRRARVRDHDGEEAGNATQQAKRRDRKRKSNNTNKA